MIMISGQIETLTTRKDKTIKITIGTQEMNPNEFADIFRLNQQFCYIGIKPEPFTKDESETLDSLKTQFDDVKSPGQRLRAILYKNYEQDNLGYKDFNSYYVGQMEILCKHFKSKLIEF